jgi:hypothetical protein
MEAASEFPGLTSEGVDQAFLHHNGKADFFQLPLAYMAFEMCTMWHAPDDSLCVDPGAMTISALFRCRTVEKYTLAFYFTKIFMTGAALNILMRSAQRKHR